MARHDDRQRVACVRAADRSRAPCEPEPACLLAVRTRLAVGDLHEREPRPLLERRPDRIEREVERAQPPREVLGELLVRRVDERARTDRLRVAPLEPLQAALGRDDAQRSERRQSSAPSSWRSITFRSSPPA
jgi:hypothetical protein